MGDPSGSESERWDLEVFEEGTGKSVVCHCDDGFGSPGSAEYSLVKGKAYTFRLRWVATNLDEGPDYDWRASPIKTLFYWVLRWWRVRVTIPRPADYDSAYCQIIKVS